VAIGGDLIHSHLLERARWKMGGGKTTKRRWTTLKFRAKPHVQTGSRILDESFLRCAPPHLHVAWVDNHLPGKGFETRALDHSWQGKPNDKPEIGLGWVYDVIIQLLGCLRLTQPNPSAKRYSTQVFP